MTIEKTVISEEIHVLLEKVDQTHSLAKTKCELAGVNTIVKLNLEKASTTIEEAKAMIEKNEFNKSKIFKLLDNATTLSLLAFNKAIKDNLFEKKRRRDQLDKSKLSGLINGHNIKNRF